MFTNLGKIGSEGPKSIGSHYKDQDHNGQVTVFSGIQVWTVPRTGEYRIEAIGASGGGPFTNLGYCSAVEKLINFINDTCT